ncbi:hypothetical protein ACVWXU_008525 [Streptomyces sp. TE33382]
MLVIAAPRRTDDRADRPVRGSAEKHPSMAKGGKLPCGVDKDTVTSGRSCSSCGGGNGWMTVKANGREAWVAAECVGIGWG